MRDPRKPGDVCFDGECRCAYLVLYRDGPDWRVEWETLRLGRLTAWWDPGGGDRIIRSGGWADPEVVQLQLF